MKVNALAVLNTLTDEPLMMPSGKDKPDVPLTLRRACTEALMFPRQEDSGEEKFKKFMLAARLNKEEMVEVSPEEVTVIKAAIGAWGGPAVVGPAFLLLNG